MIDRDGPAWARSAFWLLGAAYATLLLALLALLALGLAIGPPPADSAPAVDFDAPPEEVVRTGATRLESRDYTATYALEYRNETTGNVSGGTFARISFENTHDRRRGTLAVWWLFGSPDRWGNETIEVWSTARGMAFGHPPDEPGWQQSPSLREYIPGQPDPTDGHLSERATYEISAENATHYVVRANDPDRVERTGVQRYEVTAVVSKRPDPYLQAFTVRHVGEDRTTLVHVRVSEYGTATAPRPPGTPPVTIQEILGRAAAGLSRLF